MIRGKRKTPAHLRVIGTPTARECPVDPAKEIKPSYANDLKPPRKLVGLEKRLWNERIRKAPWLTEFDVDRAYMWVHLNAKFLRDPESMKGVMVNTLRTLGSELGFDPSSRTRMKIPDHAKTEASKYFD